MVRHAYARPALSRLISAQKGPPWDLMTSSPRTTPGARSRLREQTIVMDIGRSSDGYRTDTDTDIGRMSVYNRGPKPGDVSGDRDTLDRASCDDQWRLK